MLITLFFLFLLLLLLFIIIACLACHRAVRAVSWSDGTNLFATASDPFKAEEVGLVSIFEFPTEDALASASGMSIILYYIINIQ